MLRAATMGRALVAFSALAIVLFFIFIYPVPQDPAYYDFADTRFLLGIENFWNVMSNLPFLLVGVYGLVLVAANPGAVGDSDLRWPWIVFFTGITLTAFGSGYFHLTPANSSLVWDRLPMTLGFAGLFAIVIGEYLSPRAARTLLVPFLVAGAASVFYWHLTESAGAGDLRPYAVVQFLPVLLIPAMLIMRHGASDLTGAFWMLTLFYIAAKLLEHFDDGVAEHLVDNVGTELPAVPLRISERGSLPDNAALMSKYETGPGRGVVGCPHGLVGLVDLQPHELDVERELGLL